MYLKVIVTLLAFLLQVNGADLFEFPSGKNIQLGKFNDIQLITWKFKNTSKKNLRITRVDASCSCVKSEWPKVEIFPGQEIEINSLFDPSNFQAGKLKKYALVYISPGDKLANLSFEGEIDREIDFKPVNSNVHIQAVRPGESLAFSTEIILKKNIKPTFKLLEVTSNHQEIESKLETTAAGHLKLVIRSSKPCLNGAINEYINIKYSLEGKTYNKAYNLVGHCGNALLTHNKLVRVKLSSKEPRLIKKKLNIQFPDLVNLKNFKLIAENGEKASFALEDKKIIVTLELPESVLKKDYTGKVQVVAKDVIPATIIYLIQK
jgi:hypothetical protein